MDYDEMCSGFNTCEAYTTHEEAEYCSERNKDSVYYMEVFEIPLNTEGWLGYRFEKFVAD